MQIGSTISHIFSPHLAPQILFILHAIKTSVFSSLLRSVLTSIRVPDDLWCTTVTSAGSLSKRSCELLHSALPLAQETSAPQITGDMGEYSEEVSPCLCYYTLP